MKPTPEKPSSENPREKSIDITGIPSGEALEVPAGNLAGAPGDVLPEPAGKISKRDTRKKETEKK